MKWKTATLIVLLIFMASAFTTVTTLPVMAANNPNTDTYTVNLGGSPIQPLDDPIPGGGKGGGD